MTLDSPSNTQQLELENITKPESQSKRHPKPEVHGPKSINPSIKGDYWEWIVVTVAMEKGAQVYKNCCCNGPVDMILRINNEFIPVDVKVKKWNFKWGQWGAANGDRIAKGVYPLAVDPSTKKVSWHRVRRGTGKDAGFQCPQGLEAFWDD